MSTVAAALMAILLTLGTIAPAEAGFLFNRDKKQQLVSQGVTNSHTNNTENNAHNYGAPLTTVPEPSTVILLASGLAGLALWRLRKKI